MMKNDNTTSNQKVAIVTGASSGIGLGMAKTLLERGYRVVANSRNITKSQTLASSENLLLVDGDIGTKEIAVKVVDAAVQKFGRVDLLVNNAGIFIPKPFTDYTVEDFNNMLSTNLAGFFYVSQEAIVQMRKQKSGHVVNITTSLVDQPISGVSAGLANLTKGGLQSITKALAIEYAGEGIRVNAIAPGVVNTPMHAPETHEFLKGLHPCSPVCHRPDPVYRWRCPCRQMVTITSRALPSSRLRELGIGLPEPPSPLGAYVPASKAGSLLFLSGMLPLSHGKLSFIGRFGENLTVAQGREAARLAALNALSVTNRYLDGLDRVAGLVRLGVSLKTTGDFVEHAAVADGASEFFAQIFGADSGHTRLIYGVQSLPLGAPLALEVIFRLDDSAGPIPPPPV